MASLISKDGKIVLDAPYMEAYIPEDLFKKYGDTKNPIVQFVEDGVETIGLCNIRIFNAKDEPRDQVSLRVLSYPNRIMMYPSSITKETLKLNLDMEEDTYYVLQFIKGDILMSDSSPKKSTNCELFIDMITTGKIPYGIGITQLYNIWMKNFSINDVDPGVPALLPQLILSKCARYRKDPSKEFGIVAASDPLVSEIEYILYNMVNVASSTSVLNALTFQNYGYMLTTSLNMSKSNQTQIKSPLEKVITM